MFVDCAAGWLTYHHGIEVTDDALDFFEECEYDGDCSPRDAADVWAERLEEREEDE